MRIKIDTFRSHLPDEDQFPVSAVLAAGPLSVSPILLPGDSFCGPRRRLPKNFLKRNPQIP